MFDVKKMQECMKSLNGWRNSSDTELPQIEDDTLLESVSGLYYNDYHPYLNTEMITNSIPESEDYEEYLRYKVNQGIAKMMVKFSNKKKELGSTKTLLNSATIFDSPGQFVNKIINEGKFVGVQIVVNKGYGLKVSIDKLGFQFTQPQEDGLLVYLFHTSQEDAIKTLTIRTSKTNSFEWVTLEEEIDFSYLAEDYDSGGAFYLGYFQNDLVGQAIKKDFDWSVGPCAPCVGGGNLMKAWNERMNWMNIMPMYVAAGNLNGNSMFNYQDAVYDPANNYGINFATTIECDLSPYFCEHKKLFADALGYQVAVDVLNDIVTSTRANRITDIGRNLILRALEGDKETNEPGLGMRAQQALESLNFDFSKIDAPCLPEARKYGVKKWTV